MLFQIRSAVKPPFDAFYQGKKLKSGEEYDLPREGVSYSCANTILPSGNFGLSAFSSPFSAA